MADSIATITLSNFALLARYDIGRLRTILVLFGLAMFAGGVLMMFQHLKHWQDVQANERDKRIRLFEQRKFRRRSTVAFLISVSGCCMTALYWAQDARVFATLMLFLFAALVAVLGLAVFDLMSVGIQQFADADDEDARQKMIEEYHRLRKKAEEAGNAESQSNSDSA